MICVVSVIKYPKYLGFFGVLAMALFHIPLICDRRINFYKLMGTGKNGSFDIYPDWNQWVVLRVIKEEFNNEIELPTFISSYINLFNTTIKTFVMKPMVSHGTWDKKHCFGFLTNKSFEFNGKIAVLTRATIRLNKAKSFWKNVPFVNEKINNAKGLIYSIGMGEIPIIKQATLSIWQDVESMNFFVYQQKEHVEVMQKTRKENWYSEEMFTRFIVLE